MLREEVGWTAGDGERPLGLSRILEACEHRGLRVRRVSRGMPRKRCARKHEPIPVAVSAFVLAPFDDARERGLGAERDRVVLAAVDAHDIGDRSRRRRLTGGVVTPSADGSIHEQCSREEAPCGDIAREREIGWYRALSEVRASPADDFSVGGQRDGVMQTSRDRGAHRECRRDIGLSEGVVAPAGHCAVRAHEDCVFAARIDDQRGWKALRRGQIAPAGDGAVVADRQGGLEAARDEPHRPETGGHAALACAVAAPADHAAVRGARDRVVATRGNLHDLSDVGRHIALSEVVVPPAESGAALQQCHGVVPACRNAGRRLRKRR